MSTTKAFARGASLLVLGAMLALGTVPPAQAADPAIAKAAQQAAQAKQALAKNNPKAAFALYRKAADLDPRNLDYLHNAATIGLQLGEKDKALVLFVKAMALAVKGESSADAKTYNDEIAKIRGELPAWVSEKLAEASAFPQQKAGAVNIWSRAHAQALNAAKAGDMAKALKAAQTALTVARDNLGETHFSVVVSTADQAAINLAAGDVAKAEEGYRQAIALADTVLGASHPEAQKLRLALARLYDDQALFAQAEAVYKALEDSFVTGTRNLGANHPLALAARLAQARGLENQGRYAQALALIDKTCGAYEAAFGAAHSETATCHARQGMVEIRLADYPKATALLAQALPIQRLIVGDTDAAVLETRSAMAELDRRLGRYAEARDGLLGVIRDAGAYPALLAEAKSDLAAAYSELGAYDQAEAMAREALAAQTALYGKDHPNTAATLSTLAGILRQQGRLVEAEETFADANDRLSRVLGAQHPVAIIATNNLGEILEKEGLYDRAEPFLRAAWEGNRKALGEDHPTTLISMQNLALLYESQGTFEKAEPLYKTAIALSRKRVGDTHPDTLAVTNNLAYLYLLRQDYAQAAEMFATVYQGLTKIRSDRHQDTLKALNNLARANHRLGHLDEAERQLKQALALRKVTLGATHLDTLRSQQDLGALYLTRQRYPEAAALLEQAIDIERKVLGPAHPYVFEALNTLALVREAENDLPSAVKIRHEGFQRRSEFLDRMLWVTGDNAREGYIRLHAPEFHAYLALLTRLGQEEGGRGLLDASVRRKGLLLRVSSEIQQIARLSRDPQLTALTEELNQARKQLAALTLSGPTADTKGRHVERLESIEETIAALEGRIGRASTRFHEAATAISIDQVIEQLPEGAALVDFLVFGDSEQSRLVAGIVRKQEGKPRFSFVTYKDRAAIEAAILKYRADIQKEDIEPEDMQDSGQHAYNLIWAPLLGALGDAKEVFVVPDGGLNILPFGALVDPKGKYLIESTDLHIQGSSRDMLPSRIPPAQGRYMINAGPDYNADEVAGKDALEQARGRRSSDIQLGLRGSPSGMRSLRFDPLPGAEREGQLIQQKALGSQRDSLIFSKMAAQEKVLREMEEPPEILHIATHGFFLKPDDTLRKRLLKLQRSSEVELPPPGDNPLLRSGLAFAGINANAQFLGDIDTDNDGVLTALEVLGLNLAGTKLAVLSACETGLGEIHEGEGVYGLRRAFQEAGVSSVVSSLWEVSDAGTQTLMTALYGRLLKGMPAHEALRESQFEMLRNGQWSSPYIWAAFMMVERR